MNSNKSVTNYYYYYYYYGVTLQNLSIDISTSAKSGIISTKHFGEKFDEQKIEKDIWHSVSFLTPTIARNNPNVTFHLNIDKISIKDISRGQDKYYYRFNSASNLRSVQKKRKLLEPTNHQRMVTSGIKEMSNCKT